MHACAPLSVSVTTQNGGRSIDVLLASRRFDRSSKQSSTKLLLPFSGSRTPHRWPPKDHPGPALPQGRYSLFILTSKLGCERFCSPQEWLRLVDFWLRALERFRRSCTPSTSGTRLKVEKPGSDPRRNCLDWRAHQVWWINSVRKSSGNIFEGWWFFAMFSPTVGSSRGGRSWNSPHALS